MYYTGLIAFARIIVLIYVIQMIIRKHTTILS